MFRGTGTAIVTPFKNGKVDYENLERFIEFQIKNEVSALIVLGTTGEAPAVSSSERREIVDFAVKTVDKRVPVIAGTGSNSTSHTIEMTEEAFSLGADGALIVTPYYNKPVQEGLYRHYIEIAKNVDGPIIIYNVPSRTGVNISPETVLRFLAVENIVGIKEASGNMVQVDYLIRETKKLRPEFKVYSGNDDQAFHLACSGGDGVISVASNIAPLEMSKMIKAALNNDMEASRKMHMRLFPLMKNLFVETNPIPVKYAVSLLGYCKNELRLPLVETSEEAAELVEKTMKECGVLM